MNQDERKGYDSIQSSGTNEEIVNTRNIGILTIIRMSSEMSYDSSSI